MSKSKHRWIGLALAVALAFNTLLPFFAVYSNSITSSVAAPSTLASLFGEKVLICTGDGFALVKWTDLLAGKTPVKQHKSYFCPLCYIAANAIGKVLLLAAVIIILLTRERTAGLSLAFLYASRLKPIACSTTRSRAPPVSFCC